MKVFLLRASFRRPKSRQAAKTAASTGRRHGLLAIAFAGRLSRRLKTSRCWVATICVIRRMSDENLYFGDSRDFGGWGPSFRMHDKNVARRRAPRLRTPRCGLLEIRRGQTNEHFGKRKPHQ